LILRCLFIWGVLAITKAEAARFVLVDPLTGELALIDYGRYKDTDFLLSVNHRPSMEGTDESETEIDAFPLRSALTSEHSFGLGEPSNDSFSMTMSREYFYLGAANYFDPQYYVIAGTLLSVVNWEKLVETRTVRETGWLRRKLVPEIAIERQERNTLRMATVLAFVPRIPVTPSHSNIPSKVMFYALFDPTDLKPKTILQTLPLGKATSPEELLVVGLHNESVYAGNGQKSYFVSVKQLLNPIRYFYDSIRPSLISPTTKFTVEFAEHFPPNSRPEILSLGVGKETENAFHVYGIVGDKGTKKEVLFQDRLNREPDGKVRLISRRTALLAEKQHLYGKNKVVVAPDASAAIVFREAARNTVSAHRVVPSESGPLEIESAPVIETVTSAGIESFSAALSNGTLFIVSDSGTNASSAMTQIFDLSGRETKARRVVIPRPSLPIHLGDRHCAKSLLTDAFSIPSR
jgi:hypothetical protein